MSVRSKLVPNLAMAVDTITAALLVLSDCSHALHNGRRLCRFIHYDRQISLRLHGCVCTLQTWSYSASVMVDHSCLCVSANVEARKV